MGLFSKKPPPTQQTAPTPPLRPAAPSASSSTAPGSSGTVNLTKGGTVNLTKTSTITLTCSWPDNTDYDVYALVEYTDGHVEHVAAFAATDIPESLATADNAVRHLGDVQRGTGQIATETIEVCLNDQIVTVVPVVYSAQSNGYGSFHKYQVSMDVRTGADHAHVDSSEASTNSKVYTCVPAVLHHHGGQVRLDAIEQYSKKRSENRPTVRGGVVLMDTGPRNIYK